MEIGSPGFRDFRLIEFEGGYFPLSPDGETIDILLCEASFAPPST